MGRFAITAAINQHRIRTAIRDPFRMDGNTRVVAETGGILHNNRAIYTRHVMKTLLAIPLLVLTVVTSASARGSPSVVGVWTMVERTRDGITRRETMQPNLWIFTAKHLAVVQANGDGPRPELPPNATDQQKVAPWTPVAAEAGEYEVSGAGSVDHPDRVERAYGDEARTVVDVDLSIRRPEHPLVN